MNRFVRYSGVGHRCGFILNDVRCGNLIIERTTGEPFLIDFGVSIDYRRLPREAFQLARERELAKLQRFFPGRRSPMAGDRVPAH